MTDRDALLGDVLADPSDDGVRLVYANWLEGHGEPERAEFIRVQCRLESTRCSEVCAPERGGWRCVCLRKEWRWRERTLLANDARTLRWFGLPQPWAHVARLAPFDREPDNYPYAVVCRGFIETVTCTAADWLAHEGAIRAAQPVRAVTLLTWPHLEGLIEQHPSRFNYRFRGRKEWLPASDTLHMLEVTWPAIRFVLPGTAVGTATSAGTPGL